jgi:hypothetical protein
MARWSARVPVVNFTAVRTTGAIVLLVAAFLKWLQLRGIAISKNDPALEQIGWMILIQMEIFWGVWLLGGLRPRFTRRFSIVLFLIFAGISASLALRGLQSCGCFGNVRVDPRTSCALDLGLVAGFLLARPGVRAVELSRPSNVYRHIAVGAVWLSIGLPSSLTGWGPRLADVSQGDSVSPDARYVLLDPAQWRGKRFPLARFLALSDVVTQGRWRLFFYRRGCSRCYESLRDLSSLGAIDDADGGFKWAFIELPALDQHTAPQEPPLPEGARSVRLDPNKMWIAEVPFTITLADGLVLE